MRYKVIYHIGKELTIKTRMSPGAFVTGATRQAGRGVAVGLAALGAKVYVTSRRMDPGEPTSDGKKPYWGSLRNTVSEIEAVGGTGIPIVCDHTDDDQTKLVFNQIEKDEGRLDILFNAVWGGYDRMRGAFPDAGPFDFKGDFWEQPLPLWDEMFVGVRASYAAAAMAAKSMVASGSGLIVNLTFIAGRRYLSNVSYGASHAAIDRMTEDMAIELKDRNVAVVALCPMGHVEDKKWGGDESGAFIARAIGALYESKDLMERSGKVLYPRILAKEFEFTDTDGSQPDVPKKLADWIY